jgi:hypothetical protein
LRDGPEPLVRDVPEGDVLPAWAAEAHKKQAASVVFLDAHGGRAVETLRLPAAYCVAYQEQFVGGDATGGAYQCFLTLSDPTGWTMAPGGPASAFVTPAAREHGAPAAAAVVAAVANGWREMGIGGAMGPPVPVAAPFVVGADGVPRLPRIVGDPPFTVKGATTVKRRNGTVVTKPALDRPEYLRQLTGQETGLNKLTVAQFLANRDAYYARKKNSKRKQPDGRDPKGDAAQEVARQEAFETKLDELLTADINLTDSEARAQATQWLETQTALHDPDQVAGGHADTINGVGDARVNSAIGAAWPSRIKAIDRQIRDFAKALTPEQQRDIYLNIHLPVV